MHDVTRRTSWEDFTPHLPELIDDPHPAFAWLREHSPVHYVAAEDIWVLSRYDDVVAAARSPDVYSNDEGVGYARRHDGLALTNIDPPQHTELRRLTAGFFTPRALAAHRDRIAAVLDRLLDDALAAREIDFAEAVSNPYLSRFVGGLMGLPESDLPRVKDYATAASLRMAGDFSAPVLERVGEFAAYFAEYVRERMRARANSPDGAPRDFTDLLFDACPSGYQLTFDEIVQYEILLATGGNETTAQFLSGITILLSQQPWVLDRIRDEPTIVAAAVEELLRFISPVNGLFRHTTVATAVGNVELPAGAKVLLLYGSANHDPAHYPDADMFVIDRFPRGHGDADHVAFTTGIHVCLGAHLARLMTAVFLERMAARVSAVEVTGTVVRSTNALVRVIDELPVRLSGRGNDDAR